MFLSRQACRIAGLLFLIAMASLGQAALAGCIYAPDEGIRQLQIMAVSQPNQALARADARLREPQVSQLPTAAAWLHAVRAQAFTSLERDSDARAGAAQGLKLAPADTDLAHIALALLDAENIYDAEGLTEATRRVQKLHAMNQASFAVGTCALITLGTLQFRNDASHLAISTLMQAYRAAEEGRNEMLRVLAADALSSVMREIGDHTQALELNAEVIAWNQAHHATLALSVAQYLRGNIQEDMRDFGAAVNSFEAARSLSVGLGDVLGVAFSEMRICEVQLELGRLQEARKNCESAFASFSGARAADMVKQTRSLLAQLDLKEGKATQALGTLNQVLADGAIDLQPRIVASTYQVRARANAARGNFAAAYADLNEYTTRYVAVDQARRAREIAGQRARFETDRQIERNAALRRELELSRQRQLELQRLTWWAMCAGALVIALLTAMLYETRRHRRQLAKLANLDALTGLPNRRHIADLAASAIAEAAAARSTLTLALIDLDHFKVINDELGHAAGDQVLRDFARVSRENLRATDILGRWGGEEFLLLMPNTPPEWALGIVERLRSRALEIALPSSRPGLKVSLSAGLACTGANIASLDELVAFADAALYSAKEEGRNRVRVDGRNIDADDSSLRRAISGT
jgi:diguanylate cyclase (GGDEF)-like protein